jgi:Asp-tRNA(Asn)/Glu-tRNA(Gln) amidotransferase A subunit family amidase
MNILLGFGKEGLSLGVQIATPYWSEPDMIAFAKNVSQRTGCFVKPARY